MTTRPPPTPDTGGAALQDALQVSFRALRFVMALLLVAYLLSGIFIVGQHERAFVLVFGKIAGLGAERVKGPGIHWTFPRPIGEIVRIEAERVQSLPTRTFWPEEGAPGAPAGAPAGPGLRPGRDGYSLTGDNNVIHSRWALRYRVDDPEAHLFRFKAVDEIVHRELDHAVVKTSGRFPIDRALRTDIEAFRAAVAGELARRIETLGLGIKISGIEVEALAPPRQVAEAFNQVVAAEQERSQKISAARGQAARTLNEAEGRATQLLAAGEADQRRLVSEVSADADYFNKVHAQYINQPRVIAQTLLQDTLRRVLTRVEGKYLLTAQDAARQELRLQLGPERQAPTWQQPSAQ